MFGARDPHILRALVHRLATLRTPLTTQDAILSVRALYRLRVYAPDDVHSVCEKAAFTLVAAPRHDVDPAVLIDTVNSMTALHAQVLSASTSAGSAMQLRLCERFLDLHPRDAPNTTLQKACLVLMKLRLPHTAPVDTRVATHTLRLVHDRLARMAKHGSLRDDRLLCLAYVALFPYTAMFTAANFCAPGVLMTRSVQMLLACAEALVVECPDHTVADLRGMDALQALHLAPVLALVASSSPDTAALAARWAHVRERYLSSVPLANVRQADAILFISRFATALCSDRDVFQCVVMSQLASRTQCNGLGARDMSRVLTALTRAQTASTSAESDDVANSAPTRALEALWPEVLSFLHTQTHAASTSDCAVLLANCWQAARAMGSDSQHHRTQLCTVTTADGCVAALVQHPDALYTVLLSLGAASPSARAELVPVATQLWQHWRDSQTASAPAVESAFLLVSCSWLADHLGQTAATEETDTAAHRGFSEDVLRFVASHGDSDEAALSWLRAFRRPREVRLLLDAVGRVLSRRDRHCAMGARNVEPAAVEAEVLQNLCRVGVVAIRGSLGGQKLSLEAPWLPIHFLRLATSAEAVLPVSETAASFRVCAVALAKSPELPVADMIKVLAALSGVDLHASPPAPDAFESAPQRRTMDRGALSVLDAVCALTHGLYDDAQSFRRRCPRVRLLWRCAEAARRCGAILHLESDEDEVVLMRPTRRPVALLESVLFVVDVPFLTQPAMLAQFTPSDAAHLLRVLSETAPFRSEPLDHQDLASDASAQQLRTRLQPAVDDLVNLVLTAPSVARRSGGQAASDDYWRFLYLINANRFLGASERLFPLDVVARFATQLIDFWERALESAQSDTSHSQRQIAQAGSLANVLLESCVLSRLSNDAAALDAVRVCLRDLQAVLALSPVREDQQTALKLNMIL